MPRSNVNHPKRLLRRAQKGATSRKHHLRAQSQKSNLLEANLNELIPNTKVSSRAKAGIITNRVVSKKRAKKIQRNIKYLKERAGKTDKAAKKLAAAKKAEKADKADPVRTALWTVVENFDGDAEQVATAAAVAAGEGTTLGGPSY